MHVCAAKDAKMVERFSAPNVLTESNKNNKGIMKADLSLNNSHREHELYDSDGREADTPRIRPKKKRKSGVKRLGGWLRRKFCG